jgi:hypothetical protein
MGDSRLIGPVDMPTQRHVPRLSLNLASFDRIFSIETSGAPKLFLVHGSPAFGRPAAANGAIGFRGETIINGQLFPGPNSPPAEIQDVAPHPPGFEIGVAAVVDSLRSATAHSPIHSPMPVQPE